MDLAQLTLSVNSAPVVQATQNLSKFSAAGATAEAAATKLAGGTARATRSAADLDKGLISVGRTVSLLAVAFLGLSAAQSSVRVLTDIESGLVGIAKTTNATAEEMAKLEIAFKRMAVNLTTPIDKLLAIGAAAGQLGIRGVENISKFSRVMAELETAVPGVSGEEAAIGLARLLNLAGEGVDQIDPLSNAFVHLTNNIAALGPQILNAVTYMGQATSVARLTSTEMLAIAAATAATGQRAETAATSISKSFTQMARAVFGGGESLEQFAAAANVSGDVFAAAFSESKLGAFQLFLDGLSTLNEAELANTLKALEVGGTDSLRVMGALAAGAGQFAEVVLLVNEAIAQGNARNKEYERGADTLRGAFYRLQNAGKILIDNVLDDETGIAGGLRSIVEWGRDTFVVLSGVADESEKLGASAEIGATGIKSLAAALIAVTAVQVGKALATVASNVKSASVQAAIAAGGLALLTGSFGDLNDAILSALFIVAAFKLLPFAKQASDAAKSFGTLANAVLTGNSALQVAARGEQAVAEAQAVSLRSKLALTEATAAQAAATQVQIAREYELVRALIAAAEADVAAAAAAKLAAQERASAVVAKQFTTPIPFNQAAADVARVSADVARADRDLIAAKEKLIPLQARQLLLSRESTVALLAEQGAQARVVGTQSAAIAAETALAAANTRVGVTAGFAATAQRGLAIAIGFVKAAIVSLLDFIAKNPLGALILGLALASSGMLLFKNRTNEATDAVERLHNAQSELASSLNSIEQARAKQNLATRKRDYQALIDAINEESKALEGLQINIEALTNVRGVTGPLISFDILKQAQIPETDLRALKEEVRDKVVGAIEEGLFESRDIVNASDLTSMFDAVREAFDKAVGSSEFGFNFSEVLNPEEIEKFSSKADDALRTVAHDLLLVREAATDVERAAIFDKIREDLVKLADPAITAAPSKLALDAVDARLKELEQRAEAAKDLLEKMTTTVTAPSDEEKAAREALDSIEKQVKLERELAPLLKEEADIRRQMADIQKKADETGLAKELLDVRLKLIEADLRETAVLEKLRTAREEYVENAKDSIEDATKDMIDHAKDVDFALDSIFRSDRENRMARDMQELKERTDLASQALDDLFRADKIDTKSLIAAKNALGELTDEFKQKIEDLETLGSIREGVESITRPLGDTLRDIATGARDAEEAWRDLGDQIVATLTQRLAVDPIIDKLTEDLTNVGADIAGIDKDAGLELSAKKAAATLTGVGTTLGFAITTAADNAALAIGGSAAPIAIALSEGSFSLTAAGGVLIDAAALLNEAAIALAAAGTASNAAHGLAFANNSVVALAKGGSLDRGVSASLAAGGSLAGSVIDQPMLVPQALLGEGTRPEAVVPLDKTLQGALGVMAQLQDSVGRVHRTTLPLARMPDGNLGVRVPAQSEDEPTSVRGFAFGGMEEDAGFGRFSGMSSSPSYQPSSMGSSTSGASDNRTINNYHTWNIQSPDVEGFKRSKSQVARKAQGWVTQR